MREIGPWWASSDPDRLLRNGIPRAWGWVALSVLMFVILCGGLWAVKSIGASVTGRGDAYQQQQSGTDQPLAIDVPRLDPKAAK